MMQEGLKHFTEIPLTVLGMLIFFFVYIGVLAFTMWNKENKSRMDACAALPLEGEDQK